MIYLNNVTAMFTTATLTSVVNGCSASPCSCEVLAHELTCSLTFDLGGKYNDFTVRADSTSILDVEILDVEILAIVLRLAGFLGRFRHYA